MPPTRRARLLLVLVLAPAVLSACGPEPGETGGPGTTLPNTNSRFNPAEQVANTNNVKAPAADPHPPTGGMGETDNRSAGFKPPPPVHQEPSPFRFEDVAKSAGVDFKNVSGMDADKHFPSANGCGVAIFDGDGDGDMDLYLATGNLLPLGDAPRASNRYYENLGGAKFRDATESSGLGFAGFCHGIAVGDVDNDGDADVFLANLGPNRLYLNDGHGHFTDASKETGLDTPDGWSSGGTFFDADADGDLDLYVPRYGRWEYPRDDVKCNNKEVHTYCSPKSIVPVPHLFYRNEWKPSGRLHFVECARETGMTRSDGHGFAAVASDVDGDGKVDLYVSNDMTPNFLYLNKGDGTFEDLTMTSGAAFDLNGHAQSSMGVDAEDVDGDGLPELFVTNFQNEPKTLYENLKGGNFADETGPYNLSANTSPWVGWGASLADLDNDGWPDLFFTNGHVDDNLKATPYAEPPSLFRNVEGDGRRRFELSTRDVGPYFASDHVGRGVAFGDLDDDGRLDLVVNHKDAPPAVLMNRTPSASGRWVRLKLVGTRSNRDGTGARVEIEIPGRSSTMVRQAKTGYSMLSSHDPRLIIGLGNAPELNRVTVRWPSGATNVGEHLKAGQTYRVDEEGGIAAADAAALPRP